LAEKLKELCAPPPPKSNFLNDRVTMYGLLKDWITARKKFAFHGSFRPLTTATAEIILTMHYKVITTRLAGFVVPNVSGSDSISVKQAQLYFRSCLKSIWKDLCAEMKLLLDTFERLYSKNPEYQKRTFQSVLAGVYNAVKNIATIRPFSSILYSKKKFVPVYFFRENSQEWAKLSEEKLDVNVCKQFEDLFNNELLKKIKAIFPLVTKTFPLEDLKNKFAHEVDYSPSSLFTSGPSEYKPPMELNFRDLVSKIGNQKDAIIFREIRFPEETEVRQTFTEDEANPEGTTEEKASLKTRPETEPLSIEDIETNILFDTHDLQSFYTISEWESLKNGDKNSPSNYYIALIKVRSLKTNIFPYRILSTIVIFSSKKKERKFRRYLIIKQIQE
jgi:hypothetical protein